MVFVEDNSFISVQKKFMYDLNDAQSLTTWSKIIKFIVEETSSRFIIKYTLHALDIEDDFSYEFDESSSKAHFLILNLPSSNSVKTFILVSLSFVYIKLHDSSSYSHSLFRP